jgi:hypothetical protein
MSDAKTIIDRVVANGDLMQVESGDWVYWPSNLTRGYLTSYQMRIIANELDFRNKPIREEQGRNLLGVSAVDAVNCDFQVY